MQIHLDALGGLAGDMFAAALLDAFPEHLAGVLASVAAASLAAPVRCQLHPHNDGILRGQRFLVENAACTPAKPKGHHAHSHDHDAGLGDTPPHAHDDAGHRSWAEIRADLNRADLAGSVRDHACAIFEHLARAEAQVHGIPIEHVTFHEVGAWDSLADIVAAAHLIAVLGASRWSVGSLPLGSGRVMTAHGPLPVPAPATVALLRGFPVIDDGIAGERITPTGAAILRHLCGEAPEPAITARRLVRSGIGFGSRVLPGISNCLRVITYEETSRAPAPDHRELAVIEFEVDDQSAEDLAMGLDRLRAHPDIFDVVQMPVFGKKGRMMTHVRALARADGLAAAVEACFRETTTIGLRHRIVAGASLPRHQAIVDVGGLPVRVKAVERPGGRTAKAEADDVRALDTHGARAELRRQAEQLALMSGGKS
jgi:uncharacterized protein (TIGR00299 family) protein